MQILVVEDEVKVARALERGLTAEGYGVSLAATGDEALEHTHARPFDAILLDLMLPGRDGFAVLREIRERGLTTPVLVLTARDAVEDRVRGLDTGADDYLVKPFAFAELLARVRALLRRGPGEESVRLVVADLELDRLTREVERAGRPLQLTQREYELLEYLMRHAGDVVARETLARDVWKETQRITPLDNVIDVHMTRLRRKVDAHADDKLLHTVRGVGFALSEKDPS